MRPRRRGDLPGPSSAGGLRVTPYWAAWALGGSTPASDWFIMRTDPRCLRSIGRSIMRIYLLPWRLELAMCGRCAKRPFRPMTLAA
eukprot:1181383-Prorocentrum_minimum.AAC.10